MDIQQISAHSISDLYARIAVFATAVHGQNFGFVTRGDRFIRSVSAEMADMFAMVNIPLEYKKDEKCIYFYKTGSRIEFINMFERFNLYHHEFHSVFVDEGIAGEEFQLAMSRIRQHTSYFPNQIISLDRRYRHG